MITASLGVPHGFFTRRGGVSEGVFASLNCGYGSGDEPEYVHENRARVEAMFGGARLLTCYQIHSAEVVEVTTPWELKDAPQGDAMVTNRGGMLLGILAADCAPVLLADARAGVIGAAHAGWKGAFGGVVEATIQAMQKLGAKDIAAAVGPCIAQASYEVGPEFVERIADRWFFKPSPRQGHCFFDLKAYVSHRLEKAGIAQVEVLPHDTCADEENFFSYRRATLRGEKNYGRLASVIELKG